jgi:hypothetical protein
VWVNYPVILLILFSSFSYSNEIICSSEDQNGYHPMPESEFTMDNARKYTQTLQKYFDGQIKLDPEFILSSQIAIEGAFLRNEIALASNNPEYLLLSTKLFCNFMANKAYYVH